MSERTNERTKHGAQASHGSVQNGTKRNGAESGLRIKWERPRGRAKDEERVSDEWGWERKTKNWLQFGATLGLLEIKVMRFVHNESPSASAQPSSSSRVTRALSLSPSLSLPLFLPSNRSHRALCRLISYRHFVFHFPDLFYALWSRWVSSIVPLKIEPDDESLDNTRKVNIYLK